MLALLLASSLLINADSIGRVVPMSPAPAGTQRIESASIAGFEQFEAVGLSWRSPARALVRLRASDDGVSWTDWVVTTADDELTDQSEGKWFTGITHFGGPKRYIEYAFDRPEGESGDVTATGLRITFFAPSASRRAAAEIGDSSYSLGPLKIRSRLDWGCPDGETMGTSTPSYTHVTHAIVHHTAGSNNLTDWDAEMRAIWYYHTATNGWSDIGYNYLIDPNGVIYEGRAGGDGVLGAHFSCVNSNTVGVALLGTYITDQPTAAAQESLTKLLAELSSRFAIQPDGVSVHGASGASLSNISGHRDGNTIARSCTVTTCPGDALYALLIPMRSEIASCTPPSIAMQPALSNPPPLCPEACGPGPFLSLSVDAAGSGPIGYQWYIGLSGDISSPVSNGATRSISISPSVTTTYWVRVSNLCGSIDSASVTVKLGPPGKRRAAGPRK